MKRLWRFWPFLIGTAVFALIGVASSAADACDVSRARGGSCFAPCPQQVIVINRSDRAFVRSFPTRRAIVANRSSAFQAAPVISGRFASPITGKPASPIASPPPIFTR
ncbi:MAG: hypothetical protein IPK78_05020 [Rhodospirillales bacterium]|nr:hypothetical protein [Rhodospirillales bacterium]